MRATQEETLAQQVNKPPRKFLAVKAENISEELKRYAQWVLWHGIYKPEKEKWTKVPYQVNGNNASHSNPKTWNTFSAVWNTYSQKRDRFDGIGFVLTEKDPFVGVDFDECYNPEKKMLDPAVEEDLKCLNSYSELSPSGEGVRVLAKAKLPPGRRKKKGVEIYDNLRFLTITGHVGKNKIIEDRQEEILKFHKKHFPEKPIQNHNPIVRQSIQNFSDQEIIEIALNEDGGKFRDLYNGNTGGYSSQSEADLSLCDKLT